MNTPICDYISQYAAGNALRLHMPGHKGKPLLGMESLDITEIQGADSLYEAEGIIRESEANAASLFGCHTFYSTEGSSQCIRAMLYLAAMYARSQGKRPLIAAARNVHKTFLSGVALLGLDVVWLYQERQNAYVSCRLDGETLESALLEMDEMPAAVYLTSPDYLGELADIGALAGVCHRHGILLLVDNAHGAYLRFLQPSRHPMDQGADLSCDSAHKTLPALTGGAYLHISSTAPAMFTEQAKNALALFGSTSPSYLILQSLDAVNAYLAAGYSERLADFAGQVQALKERLSYRYRLKGSEPLKVTLCPKEYGYTGEVFAGVLLKNGVVCEFSDPDFVVMMITPETGSAGLERLEKVLTSIPPRPPVRDDPPAFHRCQAVISIREAVLSPSERLPVEECEGRVCAAATVGCPPAVPILVCGERIDRPAIQCFRYYGIRTCMVTRERF